ncbi:MAG TPA: hypothetical protein DDY37_06300 [Legionella sp.]|nr:hypothetical protein [Legionella sp.]
MNAIASTFCVEKPLNQLPLGVFILDSSGRIHEWNAWMEEKTGIAHAAALGKQLVDLFPGFEHPRFSDALEKVFAGSAMQLLPQLLNPCLIPVVGLGMMQQVLMSPVIADQGKNMAWVTLVDVTENALHQQMLLEDAIQLQEASYRDPLTNLYNRRFMSVWLEKNLLSAQRHAYPVACLMLDIDHFKQINDLYGHHVGDLVLCEFGQILINHVRHSDVCVRYGGDEFLVILSWSTLADALSRAKALVEWVRQSSLGGLAVGEVTCSIGASVFLAESPCIQDVLLKEADAQLYRAKHAGRNCVC